jgi:D-alanyl-D-alanine carboxypeptidase
LRYSNTNYIVLGVLIEEVTDRPFAEVLRARIIEPLGMSSTYLAGFEDGPGAFGAYVSLSEQEPAEPINFDYTPIATSAWAAGGIVSTAPDLHTLFTALFDGQIVSANSLAEMIGNPRQTGLSVMGNYPDYGLGIQVWNRFGGRRVEGLVGHDGWIVGYLTLVAYAPETGMTAFWVATPNWIDPSPAYAAVAERVSGTQ